MTEQQIMKAPFSGNAAKGEKLWWDNVCRGMAGDRWNGETAEQYFRGWRTPRAAADAMKGVAA